MSEGSTGQHGAGHGRWKPATPVSAMVVGRLILGVPGTIGLAIIVVIWSAITGAGLGVGRAALFSLVAVTVREIIDVSAHRIIMRLWRSRDAHGLILSSGRRVPGGPAPRSGIDDGADGSDMAAVHGLRRRHREAMGHLTRL